MASGFIGSSFESLAKARPPQDDGSEFGSDIMAYKNFKIETDADGIALVTWDTPGRSMNVLDETSVNRTRSDRQADLRRCRREGRRHHLGQGGVVRRC